MDRASVAHSATATRRRGRRARTNRGRFGSLERSYWNGSLSEREQESFEDICYAMARLYKEVRA
jgi:hypothetical protein